MNLLNSIKNCRITLTAQLISKRGDNGLWNGYLSSSAVSTAVVVTALDMAVTKEAESDVTAGVLWLCATINEDGGWGDSPESPSNLSAVLLTRAALSRRSEFPEVIDAIAKSDKWLINQIGGVDQDAVRRGVLEHYGKDKTFSVPILVAYALGEKRFDKKTWKDIPPLPFELAILPNGVFKFLKLPVVSYAIPALIAVGLARHRLAGSKKSPIYILRELAVKKVLKVLDSMQPQNGGFLEAAPLTAFVIMSLYAAGEIDHPVVKKGIDFLRKTVRKDGSWPIDTNLNMWLTTLSVKALDGSDELTSFREELLSIYQKTQFRVIHPFTKANPGGWGWSDQPGSVPDADDTSGAMNALFTLSSEFNETVENGLNWLLNLANSDGGMPTFCKGWGHLPFDRSCPDISSHTLIAFSKWNEKSPIQLRKRISSAMAKLISYLENSRDEDGVWLPLWFGDQNTPNHQSRVYGTATVLEALAELPNSERIELLTTKAVNWLIDCQNCDGGWGGEKGSLSVFETTGRATAALAQYSQGKQAAVNGAKWLVERVEAVNYDLKSSPIGLYFASLWYDEQLYPLLFSIPALRNVELLLEGDESVE